MLRYKQQNHGNFTYSSSARRVTNYVILQSIMNRFGLCNILRRIIKDF